MKYIPVLPKDREEMLKAIGVKSVDELFQTVPENIRLKRSLDLPKRLSELDLLRYFQGLGEKNVKPECKTHWSSFLGAGVYEHFIPSAVDHIVNRSEFYTAYTPYQPELSQGTLQTIFEFQSMMASLSGLPVSNASMYDGASALAEAVLMAERINKKRTVLISKLIHPEYRAVLAAYTSQKDFKFVDIPYKSSGLSDYEGIDCEDVGAVVVQYPNFFGVIEDIKGARNLADLKGALLIVLTAEPVALGLLKAPGDFGCDIFAAEGQSLGNTMSFGGPHLGIMASKKEYTRNLPGRIVSRTVDKENKEGYVLYMATREQHIRREKATSNICTNNALCALRALVHLSLIGKNGFMNLALKNLENANYLKGLLADIRGVQIKFDGPTFNEFVFSTARPFDEVLDGLKDEGIVGGVPLAKWWPELGTSILVASTEMKTKKEMDRYAEAIKKLM